MSTRAPLSTTLKPARGGSVSNRCPGSLSERCQQLALYFAWYNFCRSHRSLSGCTPAMAAGVCRKPLNLNQLLAGVVF
jgi:transposase InsO family protein